MRCPVGSFGFHRPRRAIGPWVWRSSVIFRVPWVVGMGAWRRACMLSAWMVRTPIGLVGHRLPSFSRLIVAAYM